MSGTITEGYFTEVAAEWNGTNPPTPVLLPIAAAKLRTARKIDGVSFDGTADIQHYGVCSTAAETQVKSVTITGVSLVVGAEVTVKFSSTNTASNPKLKVNETDALFIYYGGGYIQARYLKGNHVYRFVCEEVNSVKRWRIVGDIDTNTTYTPFTPETAQYADDQENGLVPGPEYGERHKFLRGDGTWKFPNFFGVCQTAGNTAVKEVNTTIGGFELVHGALITVLFANDNTAAYPALSVDGSSDYPITFNTHRIFSSIISDFPYVFMYDDQNGEFILVGDMSNIWPDGEHPIIDSNGELSSYYIPQSMLNGGLTFGGTFNANTGVATLTPQAKTKLNTQLATITLTNDNTAVTGYVANNGIFYICQTAGTMFTTLAFSVGDWILSDGTQWIKISNSQSVFTPADLDHAGTSGLVPAPAAGGKRFLTSEGNWNTLQGNIPLASQSFVGGFKTGFSESGDNYAMKIDGNGKGYVTVPIKYERNTVKFYVGGNGSHDVLGGCLCAVDTAGSVRSLFYSSSNNYYPDNGNYLIGAKIYLTEASKGFESDALEREREFVASGVFNLSAHPAYDENRTNIREGEPLFLRVVPDRGNGVFNMFSTLAGSLVTLSHLTTDSFYIYLGWMIENGYAMLEMGNPLYYCDKFGNLIDYPEYLDSFKKDLQVSKASPSASGTALAFIDAITQNEQGVITATKKTVADFNGTTHGLVPAPESGKQTKQYFLSGEGTWEIPTDTTYDVFSDETSQGAGDGVDGLVPAPAYNETDKYLRGDGVWHKPCESRVLLNINHGTLVEDGIVSIYNTNLMAGLEHGQYKITCQIHLCSEIQSPRLAHLAVYYKKSSSDTKHYIAATSEIIPAAIATGGSSHAYLSALNVMFCGRFTYNSSFLSTHEIGVELDTSAGISYGGDVPYEGHLLKFVENNDFILAEKIG